MNVIMGHVHTEWKETNHTYCSGKARHFVANASAHFHQSNIQMDKL